MASRIYTKTGDGGETGLWGGERVAKDNIRVEAYGTVDELNAVLGQALAFAPVPRLATVLSEIQGLLFELGAQLANAKGTPNSSAGVSQGDVKALEKHIDSLEEELPEIKFFILPGGSATGATLHVARAVCRRAERHLVTLIREAPDTSTVPLVFLNRLSDLLFVMARFANHYAGVEETRWSPRASTT